MDTDVKTLPGQMRISARGLRLIKAYEGFRPVDRVLISGTRVVGYGHRVEGDRAMRVTETQAEALLREDLAPFEDMINETVFAPLSQSQFDALTSLAFNIGPKAFLDSEVLHAVNNGRPLDAASLFDVWRRSEIDGRTYVVDALVRRRTAEKALFLRPGPDAMSPMTTRADLGPLADRRVLQRVSDDPVLDPGMGRLVADAPYDRPSRRREDDRAELGALVYSEVLTVDDAPTDDRQEDVGGVPVEDISVSPIAVAAAELTARLDALITPDDPAAPDVPFEPGEGLEDVDGEIDLVDDLLSADIDGGEFADIEGLITPATDGDPNGEQDNVVEFPVAVSAPVVEASVAEVAQAEAVESDGDAVDIVIDNLAQDDVMRRRPIDLDPNPPSRPPSRLSSTPLMSWEAKPVETDPSESPGPYVIMTILGATLLALGGPAWLRGPKTVLGPSGDLVASLALALGAMLLVGGLYYLIKYVAKRDDA